MTAIEWVRGADGAQGKTWNPIVGCSVVSPGCTNCYAMRMAARLERMGLDRYRGLTTPSKAGPVWTGEMRLVDEALMEPLRRKKPTTWFVNSMSDLFHESVPDAWIDQVFAVMGLTPQHTFQILTKRSARMRAYMEKALGRVADAAIVMRRHPIAIDRGVGPSAVVPLPHVTLGQAWWPLPNVWLGVSTEDQRRADERVPDLLATPAAVRFVSAEPLLGQIDFREYLLGFKAGHPASCSCGHGHGFSRCLNYGRVSQWCHKCSCTEFRKAAGSDGLHWLIVGGESGPGARPMHPDWARTIRDQCNAAGVAFFFKQWGAWGPTHPDWPRALGHALANDGTVYRPGDLAYPDGARYGEAIRAGHEKARLTTVYRVGKAVAGRVLDEVVHDGMPEVRT